MGLHIVDWAASWPMVLPYFDRKVPAGFPSPAEDYLEIRLKGQRDYTAFAEEHGRRLLRRW